MPGLLLDVENDADVDVVVAFSRLTAASVSPPFGYLLPFSWYFCGLDALGCSLRGVVSIPYWFPPVSIVGIGT